MFKQIRRSSFNRKLHYVFVVTVVSALLWFVISHFDGPQSDQASLTRESSDYRRLIDLEDFKFLRNHPGCSKLKNDPKIVIMVHSAPQYFEKRRVIRETWGSPDDRSLLLFVMGAFNDDELEARIDAEARIFEDIVQGNFLDTYHNLSHKATALLKWFVYNCPDANFLLKTDDDVFINTPHILDLLSNPTSHNYQFNNENSIFCKIIFAGSPVLRDSDNKWYVSREEFAADTYPEYCTGQIILYSASAAFKIYEFAQSQTVPYLWLDDVHLTGSVRMQANVTLFEDSPFFLVEYESGAHKVLDGQLKIEDYPFIFDSLSSESIRKLWDMVKNGTTPRRI